MARFASTCEQCRRRVPIDAQSASIIEDGDQVSRRLCECQHDRFAGGKPAPPSVGSVEVLDLTAMTVSTQSKSPLAAFQASDLTPKTPGLIGVGLNRRPGSRATLERLRRKKGKALADAAASQRRMVVASPAPSPPTFRYPSVFLLEGSLTDNGSQQAVDPAATPPCRNITMVTPQPPVFRNPAVYIEGGELKENKSEETSGEGKHSCASTDRQERPKMIKRWLPRTTSDAKTSSTPVSGKYPSPRAESPPKKIKRWLPKSATTEPQSKSVAVSAGFQQGEDVTGTPCPSPRPEEGDLGGPREQPSDAHQPEASSFGLQKHGLEQ